MIIFDLSQICLANIMMQLGEFTNAEISESTFRHMILNTIRKNVSTFRKEYGDEIIIACDGYGSWRRDFFRYYKAGRKKNREESDLDWNTIFKCISLIKDELREYFPYRVIEIERCEADDVIGTLAAEFGTVMASNNKILVLSGDKDFNQLQRYANVSQFDPIKKKKIVCNNAELYLREHIIRGDKSDGVPNILSADDTFVKEGGRNTTLSAKRMASLMTNCEESLYYNRNKTLIDLTNTPENLRINILESYHSQSGKKKNLLNYFIKFRLTKMIESIGDF